MTQTSLIKTVFFNASPETVWDFLTDKNKLGEWFHPAENSLSENSDYALTGENHSGVKDKICWGTVNLWQPFEKLGYSFTIGPLAGVSTQVLWILDPVANGTRLTLEHSDIPAKDAAAYGIVMALDAGWDQHFGKLRALLKA